jgi:ATP-dependent protease ClpP protease subunit
MAPGVTVKAAATPTVLRLYGEVGVDVLVDDVARALDAAGGRDVEIHLFSPGGVAAEGMAIHDVLAAYRGKKTYVIDGLAASAGSIIPLAINKASGDRRLMPDNALLMIHNCWGGSVGDADSMDAAAAMLRLHSQVYSTTYAKASGQSVEQILEWMGAAQGGGTWFTAEAALAAGLIDAVIDPVDVRASVPALPAGRFPNPPGWVSKALASMVRIESGDHPEHSRAEHMPTQDQAGSAPAAVIEAPPVVASTEAAHIATVAPAVVQAAVSPAASTAVAESVALANARRENEIRRCAAEANIAPAAVQAMVDSGKPFADVALEIVKAHAGPLETVASKAGHPARLQVTRDAGDTVMAGIGDMLYARINPLAQISGVGQEYRGYSLMECVRAYANSRGISTVGRSKNELVAMAMHSTSDFPLLFSNLAGKSLTQFYEEEPHTWKGLARQRNLPDFKNASDLTIAADLTPELTPEGGEYKTGTLKEAQGTWRLFTYTKKIVISRHAIINDDLSALERTPEFLGRGFRRLESNLIWAMITGDANVSVDNLALFNAAHNNTGTGPIGIAGVNVGRKAMRKQRDISNVAVNLTPEFLIVPSDLEGTGEQFLDPNGYAPAALTGNSGPNPYTRKMRLIVEPRLDGSATQWYLAAGPTRTPGMVWGYLADEPGPTITSEPERDPDGLKLLARSDFGCAIEDFRFIYRSSGV